MQLISSETNALMDVLKKTAPGTALREGLDNVLRANTGGLIVIGDPAKIKPLTKGARYLYFAAPPCNHVV